MGTRRTLDSGGERLSEKVGELLRCSVTARNLMLGALPNMRILIVLGVETSTKFLMQGRQ